MTQQSNMSAFGEAAKCSSLADVEEFISRNRLHRRAALQAACFGLALVARQAVGSGTYFIDVKNVLDKTAEAKAAIDIVSWHSIEVARVTAAILLSAQQYLDEHTIPCTEWPTPNEVACFVFEESLEHCLQADV